MQKVFKGLITLTAAVAIGGTAPGCAEIEEEQVGTEQLAANAGGNPSIDRGRDIWFNNTYGGEKFFSFLAVHPDPTKRIKIGFEKVLNTPRAVRHQVWGTINDPDCTTNPAGGMDICPDGATGVVGIRKSAAGFGVACAACHAGFDPTNPPVNPAEPSWDNIHATIGNQHLKTGKIFAANLNPAANPHDAIRGLVFSSWPDGSVDTTALFSDNINNPGTITAFWAHNHRNSFDVGMDEPKLRNGQGGEDDVGGDIAALRVYTNIGVCFFECVAGPAATGGSISIDACRQNCADFPPQQDLDDMTNFLASFEAPQFPGPIDDLPKYNAGKDVFDANCAGCHDNDDGHLKRVLSDDEMNSLAELGANATNACRALGTNWDPGNIWAEFTSFRAAERLANGTKGYRNMPLSGIWSTPPFMHNQSIGFYADADASFAERRAVFEDSMHELLSASRVPAVHTIPVAIGPFPAGTPLALVVNRDPATGQLLCGDYVENRGHYFGANLSEAAKDDLIYYLLYQ